MRRLRRTLGRAYLRLALGRLLSPEVPYEHQRRRVEALGRRAPVPPATRVTQVDLGGVPAERVELGSLDPRRAILLMHSGGHTIGSARSQRPLSALLSCAAGAAVFSLDYRLAPEHPYPAALEDVLAAFAALRAQGFEPADIAFGGDSAGGNLSLAAAMRLRDEKEDLPAALLLLCPLLDLTHTGESITFNADREPALNRAWGMRNAEAYAGARDLRDPGISPLFGSLSGLPPIHLQSAGDDLILSDADRLEERARREGLRLEHRRQPRIWHDFQAMPALSGAAGEAIRDGGEALRRIWEGRPFASELPAKPPRVAIIGAGFAGLGMAIQLKRAGIESFTIFERAGGVGGTWRENTYPGAACDIPSHLYSLSFEPNHDWSRRYSPQGEILAYLEGAAERNALTPHLRLDTEVASASFDEQRSVWRIETTGGERHEAEVLVSACGQLSRPSVPPIPGAERFAGPIFHSAEWDHDAEIAGRRVAVVGTGASSIQIIPEVAQEAGALHVFQRSAPYVVPRLDTEYGAVVRALYRHLPPLRVAYRFLIWAATEFFILGFGRSRRALAPLRLAHEHEIAAQVPEGPRREALTPVDEIGCKRILFSSDYYPAMARDDVELVTEPISEISERGILTADGVERELDVIVWGTGFKSNDFLTPMRLFGRGGRELNEAWQDGARAYLGISVSGFPNLFLLYGPNTNLGSGSMIHMLESQIAHTLDAIKRLRRQGGGTLEVRPGVEDSFDRAVQERLADSVWMTGCNNWYVNEQGRNTNNWPGFTFEYRRRTRRLDPADYVLEAN